VHSNGLSSAITSFSACFQLPATSATFEHRHLISKLVRFRQQRTTAAKNMQEKHCPLKI